METHLPAALSALCRTCRYRTLDRIDHPGKLKQHTVPRGLHEATAVFCHEGVGNLAVFAECAGGADLVEPHEPRVVQPRRPQLLLPICVRHELAAFASWPSCPGDTILARMPPVASLGPRVGLVNKWNRWSFKVPLDQHLSHRRRYGRHPELERARPPACG